MLITIASRVFKSAFDIESEGAIETNRVCINAIRNCELTDCSTYKPRTSQGVLLFLNPSTNKIIKN